MAELVVMRLADMHRTHPRQDNTKICSRCAARVGVYPSGQRALLRDSSMRIVCNVCVAKEDIALGIPAAASWQEIAQEARDSAELKKQ
jgi:hypothetical protein